VAGRRGIARRLEGIDFAKTDIVPTLPSGA
jgi:hypothetical protein